MTDKNDALGNRMKQHEAVPKKHLCRRIPVIVRCDGRAFHSFCKRFEKPYDANFHQVMNKVMEHLCLKIQGVKFAQRHSDEMSFLLTDYDTLTTDAYFDYNVDKINSTVAAMATAEFCKQLVLQNQRNATLCLSEDSGNLVPEADPVLSFEEDWPTFDCRCFNLPESEVASYYWWRLLDSKRNSINMQAQDKFSHKQLQGKTCEQMQEMLFKEHGINWGKLPAEVKAGFVCYRENVKKVVEKGPNAGKEFERSVWKASPAPSTKQGLDLSLEAALTTPILA